MGAVPPRLLAYPPKPPLGAFITPECPAGMPFLKDLPMKSTAKKLSDLQAIPLLKQESLYIGIDIGLLKSPSLCQIQHLTPPARGFDGHLP